MTSTKFGLAVEEYDRLIERAERFYKEELEAQLIDDHKGDIVEIDGRTLKYAIGSYRISDIHRDLVKKCDTEPVVFTARVGSDAVYDAVGATVLYEAAE